MSADLPKFTAFNCAAIGVAGTTDAFVQKAGDLFIARVGIAILGADEYEGRGAEEREPIQYGF